MKIRIEIDQNLEEEEIVIRCKELSKTVQKVQQSITDIASIPKLVFYKNEVEYYLSLDSILFFETSDNMVDAHTKDDTYQIKLRLYELENILPSHFVRISKSTILNINDVYSIDRNITSSSIIRFYKSYKQVYVSRMYYKILKQRLAERRNYEI